MGSHIIDGEFQSDKYPTTPRGKVPLSVKDPTAQDLLWEYAQRRRKIDAEFSEDLETALRSAGYVHRGGPVARIRELEAALQMAIDERTCNPSDECHRATHDHIEAVLAKGAVL